MWAPLGHLASWPCALHLQQALREAQDDLEVTQRILEEAKQRLREVEDGIAMMQTKYRECIAKKEELELKCEQCEQRLSRADKVHTPLLGGPVDIAYPKQTLEGPGWWGPGVAVHTPSLAALGAGTPRPPAQPPRAHLKRLPLQLINGLSDERVRWQETVENLEHMLDNIFGDVLVAAGFVAYLGPFTVRWPQPCLGQPHLSKRPCLEASLP